VPRISLFNPAGLSAPLGPYSHIARVQAAEFVFIAGQVAIDAAGNLVGADDFEAQCAQAFANLAAALAAVGAGWGQVVQFTTYLVHSQDIGKFTAYRGREFPHFFPDGAYPPNTLLIVDRLAQEALLIEVQAIAAL
jgi:enamine deaminase RidA (YjgF/YER057c/UK114 family)